MLLQHGQEGDVARLYCLQLSVFIAFHSLVCQSQVGEMRLNVWPVWCASSCSLSQSRSVIKAVQLSQHDNLTEGTARYSTIIRDRDENDIPFTVVRGILRAWHLKDTKNNANLRVIGCFSKYSLCFFFVRMPNTLYECLIQTKSFYCSSNQL